MTYGGYIHKEGGGGGYLQPPTLPRPQHMHLPMNIIMHIGPPSFLCGATRLVAQVKESLEAVHEHWKYDAIEGPGK